MGAARENFHVTQLRNTLSQSLNFRRKVGTFEI